MTKFVALKPESLLDHALGTIDVMAEAMWQDEALRRNGKPRAVAWAVENHAEREVWTRRATVAFMTMLEPKSA
jgi:hypothetical protein